MISNTNYPRQTLVQLPIQSSCTDSTFGKKNRFDPEMFRMLRTSISPLRKASRASSLFNGPGLEDFLKGDVEEKTFREYSGKLKRERGDKRLPLPPWLKGIANFQT